MAAYAALVTLVNLMEDMQNHPRLSTCFHKKQIESLGEKVQFLLNFIESYDSHGGSKEAEDLESEIVYAAQEAEDVIESHIVDRILAAGGEISSSFLLNLQKVIEEMDLIKNKAVKIGKKAVLKDKLPKYSVVATSSRPRTNRKTSMVGFDEELLIQLVDLLITGPLPIRPIISVVGTGGMGKTTLTRNAYENSFIKQHFGIREWVTVSQEYSARDILSKLLYEEISTSKTTSELGDRLYKYLSCKKYLIVLDDMWSVDAWDEIRQFFPDNVNGSRIVITTRLSSLASHVRSSPLVMKFLDKDKGWKLFCEKAFGEGHDCPLELVEIGKEIVEQCQGLLLSIVVIGGYLSKSSRTKEHWEYIANEINTCLSSRADEQCLKILSLSYSNLPTFLKPCFLYMGVFSKDEETYVPELIRLWVAEGYLKPNKSQTLEEIAESYFNDLADRNLILVHEYGRDGKIQFFKIHDLLRELCLKMAEKEKFLCVLKLLDSPRPINRERRVAIHGGTLDKEYCNKGFFQALKSAPLLRSLICSDANNFPFYYKLLKIQNMCCDFLDKFDADCLEAKFHQQVNLRYLDHSLYFDNDYSGYVPTLYLPSSISRLWNLQTLILHGSFLHIIAPLEIWQMLHLRHLFVDLIYLPDPPRSHHIVLQNLQTLSKVDNLSLSEEVCKRIPNIKNLNIKYFEPGIICWNNLGRLCKLESLTCDFNEEGISCDLALSVTFPRSLKELCLTRCFLRWEDLTIVGSLPCLEVLELGLSMKGNEWNPIEGEFLRLKYLEIWCCDDLINWNADNYHFPVLESLNLRSFSKLTEIPSGIGEIPTLRQIQLRECTVPASVSAMRILVEQESLGNQGLRLEVWLSYKEDNQSFTKKVREEGLNSNSLHLTSYYRHRGEKKLKGIEDAEVPNKPKRPPRAFFVFMENFMKQYNEKHPNNKSTAAIVKAGGDKWKSMSEEEKTSVAEAEEYGQKMEAGSNRKLAGGGDNDPGKSKSEVDDEDEEEGSGEFSRLYEAFESLIFGNLH